MPRKMKKANEKFIDIEGKSVEDAIETGINRLNLPREKVEIKILSEPQSGLFGMGGPAKAKVRLYY